jgi:hypothetical protein
MRLNRVDEKLKEISKQSGDGFGIIDLLPGSALYDNISPNTLSEIARFVVRRHTKRLILKQGNNLAYYLRAEK